MKHILLNLKRFDIPHTYGGVNRLAQTKDWGRTIIEGIQDQIAAYSNEASFHIFFPESQIIPAKEALKENTNLHIGCQSVHRADVVNSENFGAFTSHRAASAMKAIGCTSTIIGHTEERRELEYLMQKKDMNDVLNEKVKMAQLSGLKVVYCIGEKEEEKENWQETLKHQLTVGLREVDMSQIIIAYEPVWAIGPGKEVPTKEQIEEIMSYIKTELGQHIAVVYGGGMKIENAEMLASVNGLDGGLIALTRFTGEIGFYSDEYLNIVKTYLRSGENERNSI